MIILFKDEKLNILSGEKENKKVCPCVFIRYGNYAGLREPRYHVVFDDGEHKYYKKKQLEFLLTEYNIYKKNQVKN